ncbi:MAG: EAL domain-containing protein [Gallionella sp.]|nr:MAG: EAL domain-containing protein [Gallionella sp.]
MRANEINFLVIEDNDFQRRMVVHMLRSLGATEVHEASNGKHALEMVNSADARPFDIAFCDLNMPEMDGMEFLRHLGSENGAVSIIILSMLDRPLLASVEKMSRAYGVKLLGAIEKPITLAQLEVLISQYGRLENKPQRPVATETSFSLDEILQGVHAKQFEPFFQPKIELKTGRMVGVEALARWIHPQRGVIGPYAFIPQLEQNGEIDELTFLMLEKAAGACRLLHGNSHKPSVSVNLSLVSLDDTTLADRITQVVQDAGVDPYYITLEITESAAMTDIAPALENLARLRMRGFGLSIDDYGTGYASMQQLTRIAFSELKIDQSFVKEFAGNKALCIIVESSIRMAGKLHVKSIAEGVETQQDWDMLKEMRCDAAQGYFIAKPMNLAALLEFSATR